MLVRENQESASDSESTHTICEVQGDAMEVKVRSPPDCLETFTSAVCNAYICMSCVYVTFMMCLCDKRPTCCARNVMRLQDVVWNYCLWPLWLVLPRALVHCVSTVSVSLISSLDRVAVLLVCVVILNCSL